MPPATAQNSQQAQQNLQSYTGSMQTPDQAIANANNQFQVGQQQQQVQGLRTALQNTNNLLNQVAPSVMGRTQNSLVTSAQANRQIQNEQAPLNTQFNKENQDYGNANQDYQSALSQAQSAANANLGFQNQHQSYLQGVYNDLYTQEQQAATLAEQRREADLQASTARATSSASSGASPSFSQPGGGYSTGTDKAGGVQFFQNSKPITAMQYVQGQGGNWQDLTRILSQSKNPGDAQIVRDMLGGMNQSQLTQKYPYVFGVR